MKTATAAWLRTLVAFLIVPNLALWLLGQVAYSTRAVLNVDYLAAGTLLAGLPPAVLVAALTIALMLDVVAAFAPIYHFTFGTALRSIGNALELSPSGVGPAFLLLLAFGVGIAMLTVVIAGPQRATRRARLTLLAAAILVLAVDAVNGTLPRARLAEDARANVNIATSPGLRLLEDRYRALVPGEDDARAGEPVASASVQALAGTDTLGRGPTDIVIVLVESWGLLRDSTLQGSIVSPYQAPAVSARYHVRHGTVPFAGATTAAELRELCSLRADERSQSVVDLRGCLPARHRSRGYQTIAIHGYRPELFHRDDWYPRLGFDSLLFIRQLRSRSPDYCGTLLRGVCDREIPPLIASLLRDPRPQFVYWLTLNSHLPVDAGNLAGRDTPCPDSLRSRREVCLMWRLTYAVHQDVAALAAGLAEPAHLVVVGDHAPPFARRHRRAIYAPAEVPWLELIPRRLSADSAGSSSGASPAGSRARSRALPG